jgi:hypothetical protein
MSLSVCCLTADPASRVVALMEQLRPVADEIVIAADSRVPEAELAGYASVADRLLRCEFRYLEAHLAWLHEQCSGDWILRMDGDEVLSPGLVDQLPRLTQSCRFLQYWLPRRWLHPDPQHWLEELPWTPDYQLRLVRNDGTLSFSGDLHSGPNPVWPAAFLEEPFYHLLFLLENVSQREARVARYEALEPDRVAPGGGPFNETYYLPERHMSRPPAEVPLADLAAIDAVLSARGGVVPLTDPLPETHEPRLEPGLAAKVAPAQPDYRMFADETRELFVRVTNRGAVPLPGWTEDQPPIRLSYHWRGVVHGGLRTPLPHQLLPGETCIAPVLVRAPSEPGAYVLEFDVVHEHVRWFECGFSEPVDIVRASGERLR